MHRSYQLLWRLSGLVVSALASRSSGPGSNPSQGTLRCVLGQDTLFSQCLSPPGCINGYWWIQCSRVTLRWTSIPSRGSRNILSRFMLWKLEIRAGLMCHLAHMQTSPYLTFSAIPRFLQQREHQDYICWQSVTHDPRPLLCPLLLKTSFLWTAGIICILLDRISFIQTTMFSSITIV